MLVIRRRSGESFLLGEDIEVIVLEVKGSQVKLGIKAPVDVQILRKEVLQIRDQNLASARKGVTEVLLQRLVPHKEK